jgi:hypothetical protein
MENGIPTQLKTNEIPSEEKLKLILRAALTSVAKISGPLGLPVLISDEYRDLMNKRIETLTEIQLIALMENLQEQLSIIMKAHDLTKETLEDQELFQSFSADSFYEKGREIVDKSTNLRLASKTPALIVPSEREGYFRKRYFNALVSAINSRDRKVRYLFCLPTTEEMLINIAGSHPEELEKIFEDFINLLSFDNLDLRYTLSEDFVSCIIGDDEVIFLWKSPVTKRASGVTSFKGNNMSPIKDMYDILFEDATPIERDVVKKMIHRIKFYSP